MTVLQRVLLAATLTGVSALSLAQAPPAQTSPAESRGQLLYDTHCITCHTTQMHWRNDRKAYDWDSLKMQVRRWQGNAGLQWDDGDIAAVARHLNQTIYHYPQTDDRVSMVSRPTTR